MVSPEAPGSDRDQIVRTVAAADRRLRAARFVRDLAFGSTLILYLAVIIQVIAHLLPLPPVVALGVGAGGIVVLAAGRAWVLARCPEPARAAAAIDRAAGLRDELASAHWFARRPVSTPPLELHVRRAAAASAGLNLVRLVPITLSRRAALTGAAVVAALVAVSLVPVDRTRSWVRGAAALTAEDRARLDEVERLLAREPGAGAARAALQSRIDELLRKLREGGLSPEDTLAVLDELRQRLGAAAAGSDAARRDALARIGAALAAAEASAAVGDAMTRGDLDDAARRMRDLAESIEEALQAGGVPPGLQHALERASGEGGLADLASELGGAASAIGRRAGAGAKRALERAAGEIEDVARLQEFEQSLRNATAQLDSLEQSLGSRFGSPRASAERADSTERQMFPSQDLTPGGTPPPGASPGRTAEAVGQPPPGATLAPSDATGSSAPGPLGAPSVRNSAAPIAIEVNRRREILPAEPAPAEPKDERTIDEETRATRATVEYRPVAAIPAYAEAERLTPDTVPWPYRDLVKAYFRLLGPRGDR